MSVGLLRGWLPVAAAALLAACGTETGETRSVLVISLDTTRADALGSYGNRAARTPVLDRLAARGTVFERAYTVVPMTLPSHASMFTGLTPPRHTVRGNGPLPLPADAETTAEAARGAGYATAAFVSAAVLDPRFGLAQGFETYDGPADGVGREQHNERSAAETLGRASAWLKSAADRDFFLWVHLFDPHAPYEPPRGFARGSTPGDMYQAEVDALDARLGQLLDALASTGADEHTLVLVVGDHGEGLGEHGEATHGSLCYESTLRVPLIVAGPGLEAGRSRRVVSVVDVHATALEWMGLAPPEGGDGRSLIGETPGSGGAYFEAYTGYLSYGWSPMAGYVDDTGKYVHSPTPELFDPLADPGETRNLLTTGADGEPWRRAIAELVERPALDPAAGAAADRELAERIQALGYAEAARATDDLPHPLAPSDLPSPHRMADEEQNLHALMDQVARGLCREARPGLEALVARNGRNLLALDMLAHCAASSGDVDGAIVTLQRLVAQSPPWPDSYHRLGGLLLSRQRTEEAMEAFAGGLAVDPGHAGCLQGLVRLLEAAGRTEEAERYRALARERQG